MLKDKLEGTIPFNNDMDILSKKIIYTIKNYLDSKIIDESIYQYSNIVITIGKKDFTIKYLQVTNPYSPAESIEYTIGYMNEEEQAIKMIESIKNTYTQKLNNQGLLHLLEEQKNK